MDIYDSRYFVINKRMQKAAGVWPFQSRLKNKLINLVFVIIMIGMLLPQFIRLSRYLGKDSVRVQENIFILLYAFGTYIKLFTAIAAQDKLKILYENTAQNFSTITDDKEKKILLEYSERGRNLTITFTGYMFAALTVFVMIPMVPVAMDVVNPLNETRNRYYILYGDYLIDNAKYYFVIWFFDSLSCTVTVFLMCSTDPMYVAIVEHCLGLFSIIKYRLKTYDKHLKARSAKCPNTYDDEEDYQALVEIVKLHKKVINFTDVIQESYSTYFLLEIGATLFILTSVSLIIVIKLKNILDSVRYIFVLIGLLIHIFYLSWPGQKLIDYSGDIFKDTYHGEWYEKSIRCQNLLKFLSLRCSKPCQLTGAGLVIMNFENFAAIVKTSASYITVFSNFQPE